MALRPVQENHRPWLGLLLTLALLILFVSGYLTLTRLSLLPKV